MPSDGRRLWLACNGRVARNALDVEGLGGLEVGGGGQLGNEDDLLRTYLWC